MALIDEMKLRRSKLEETLDEIVKAIEEQEDLRLRVERELDDFDRAIAALKPTPAAVTEPEPEPEPQDDASEFSEEGYAPVTQAEPPAMEGVAFVDGKWTIPGPSFEEMDDDGLEPGPVDEASHPMAAYVPATDPQADALAKAADYYSPEAVAERNRFDPFRMFKRETEET